MFSKSLKAPSKEAALPGRETRMPVPDVHFVNRHRLEPPFPEGLEQAMFGMGCFWGAERKFWELPGVYTTAVGYAAGHTPNPTYREVCSGMTGHAEVVLVVFDPNGHHLRGSAEGILGEPRSHTGDAPRQRRRHPVSVWYLLLRRGAAARGRSDHETRISSGSQRRVTERMTTEIVGSRVLLRRGLSPAVSCQEPRRVLRHWRDRRQLSRRHRRSAVACRRSLVVNRPGACVPARCVH